MTLYIETITSAMHLIAQNVFEKLDEDYYLAGGTALALHIGHRKSVDLDYFIAKPIDTLALKDMLSEIFPSMKVEIIFEAKNTLWCIIDGVKVSFISRFDVLVEPVQTVDYFRLVSVKDIVVMKLIAVCGREEYKDYFDIACMGEISDVRSWVFWWQKVYPMQDIVSWVVALSSVDSVKSIPLEVAEDFKNKNVSSSVLRIVKEITQQVKLMDGK